MLTEQPGYTPAWIAWADMCLEHGNPNDLEQVIARLDVDPQRVTEAAMLRGRLLMSRREFVPARQMLEGIIAQMPQAVWPRVLLSHVLLQEERDSGRRGAGVLREILALEPNQREARYEFGFVAGPKDRRTGSSLEIGVFHSSQVSHAAASFVMHDRAKRRSESDRLRRADCGFDA